MKGIAFNFFIVAALCVTAGMVWGIQMSATQDHGLSPAHAHLNLVGWVTMGLFGLYYAVTPTAAQNGLAKIHFWMATLGVVLMVPGIVMALTEQGEVLAILGSFLTLASMLIFVFTVARNGIGKTD
jgi:cbb3-type cytochrome oxidase subunit 1